jgi:hypothetical protein
VAISELYTTSATVSTTELSVRTGTGGPGTDTADGVYQLFLDLNALAAGDQFELKAYEKVSSGGTQRLIEAWIFDGAQSKPCWVSPNFIFMHGWDFTLKKLAGTDRSIPASVRQVA